MPKYLLNFEDFKKAEKEFKKEVAKCESVLKTSIDSNVILYAWKRLAESYWLMDSAARDVKDNLREQVWKTISIVDA